MGSTGPRKKLGPRWAQKWVCGPDRAREKNWGSLGPRKKNLIWIELRGVIKNHVGSNLVGMLRNMQQLSDICKTGIPEFNVDKIQLPILVHSASDVPT